MAQAVEDRPHGVSGGDHTQALLSCQDSGHDGCMAKTKSWLPSWIGRLIGWGAIALAYLTTPWAVAMSAALATWAVLSAAAFKFVSDPHLQTGVQVFLALLWTYTGLRFLEFMRSTSTVKVVPDYRYAINPEGYQVALDEEHPDAAFQLGVHFRNMLNLPLKVRMEQFRLTIEDRVCPDPDNYDDLIIPRVSARGVRSGAFKREAIKDRTSGVLDFTLIYGDPDGEFVRRYHQRLRLNFVFIKDDDGRYTHVQVADEIELMEDGPI